MNVGILVINEGEAISDGESVDIIKISKSLNERNYFVENAVFVTKKDAVADTFEYLKKSNDALLVIAKADLFYQAMADKIIFNKILNIAEVDSVFCAVTDNCDEAYLNATLLPMLNSMCKTTYSTVIFKTFEKTEEQLKEMLKDCIKNHNRIVFKFYPSLLECDVVVRYSNKADRAAVDEVIAKVTEILLDCTYSLKNSPINEVVANLLLLKNKRIGLAESFTGGGITASLVSVPGISESLKEGIVCYSNESKISRLKVDEEIIKKFGAVSIETVYEMAANILMQSSYDIAVATTGNAGPTSEKENETGVCFIAVGDISAIHIYKYTFKGERLEVIECGVKTALFRLYKLLTQDEFKETINSQIKTN